MFSSSTETSRWLSPLGPAPGPTRAVPGRRSRLPEGTSRSNVAGGYVTALVGKAYTTDVSEKYVVPQMDEGRDRAGSYAVSSPFSSYASLLAEVGVLGFAIIVGIYLVAVKRAWPMSR